MRGREEICVQYSIIFEIKITNHRRIYREHNSNKKNYKIHKMFFQTDEFEVFVIALKNLSGIEMPSRNAFVSKFSTIDRTIFHSPALYKRNNFQ